MNIFLNIANVELNHELVRIIRYCLSSPASSGQQFQYTTGHRAGRNKSETNNKHKILLILILFS